jgi:hypothetical protein
VKPVLTVQMARAAGWLVYETHDGAWGQPATRRGWKCKPASWPEGVQPERLYATRDDALSEIEERLSAQYGLAREVLQEKLLELLSQVLDKANAARKRSSRHGTPRRGTP